MTENPYRDLIAEALDTGDADLSESFADDTLASRIPWLCPHCKGKVAMPMLTDIGPNPEQYVCTHPNAPTIAQLLAERDALDDTDALEGVFAWRLMMLRRLNPDMGGPNMQDRRWAKELVEELLAALREVKP